MKTKRKNKTESNPKNQYQPTGKIKHSDKYRHSRYEFGVLGESSLHSGLTHSPKQGKHSTFPLLDNPDANDKRKSYLQTQVRSTPINILTENKKGLKLSERDRIRVEQRYGKKIADRIEKLLRKPKQ